jgi:hypothetical protein
MRNRGSKSDFITKSVKEQRVDGSWYGVNIPYLRCTLTGFERNYRIKVPSNQINKLILYTFFLEVLLVSPESCVNPTDSFLVFLGVIPAVTYTNADLVKQDILERSTPAPLAPPGFHLFIKKSKEKGQDDFLPKP